MSSDEGEPTSPVLPEDSDRGSSVSSELQDEYEELLRYAVVTPKFEPHAGAPMQLLSPMHGPADGRSSRLSDDARSHHSADAEVEDGRQSSRSVRSARASPVVLEPRLHSRASQVLSDAEVEDGRQSSRSVRSARASPVVLEPRLHSRASQVLSDAEVEDGRQSSRSVRSARASPVVLEPRLHSRASQVEETLLVEERAGQLSGSASVVSDVLSEREEMVSVRSRQSSLDPLEVVVTEMFVSSENLNKMESILDTWSDSLKSNVLAELRKWKLLFMEEHRLELEKEREKHAAQTAGLNAELDSLKGLLNTYETSNQRKDEVIVNLSCALDRQKERLETMRAFTHWRLQHSEAKEEAHAAKKAEMHYNLNLKKKVWGGWASLIQRHWKDKVERACRARAEEVCRQLSTEYEAKMAEHCEAVEKAQAEIQRMRLDRDRYEDSMKKAFMRGVCALNMEALTMFNTTEGRSEQPAVQDQHDDPHPRDEPGSGSGSLLHLQPGHGSSARFSPITFDPPGPSTHSEVEETLVSSAPMSRAEGLLSTKVVHSSLPTGGVAGTHKQVSGRVVTAGQQKPSKTVTARISARPDLHKTSRSSLQVMGVAPPMSSVIVERHHPITQLTVGQAVAAKFPRSSQQSQSASGGKSSSRTHSTTCHVHSIKVVD